MTPTSGDGWWKTVPKESAWRRAGGRRRYNAIRRRRADARRAAMGRALDNMGPAILFSRHLAPSFARAFGVHRTTAWRDLWLVTWGGRQTDYVNREGETVYSVVRAYPADGC